MKNTIKSLKKPSCITLQECKLKNKTIRIPGYQLYVKNRENNSGGGLITAIDENLTSIQVSSCEQEILVIEVSFEGYKIRIINAYGPQEPQGSIERQQIHEFWQEVETQISLAKDNNCYVVLQCDANAKLGSAIFQKDPHKQTENGFMFYEMVRRQNLFILNMDEKCQGSITRHRKTKNGDEKSIIDFLLVCDQLKVHFEQMIIDEERTHILTKYSSVKGVKTKIESDHNIQFAKFNIKYNEIRIRTKREIFNFKDSICQEMFFKVTENTKKLSSCFQSNDSFLKQSDNFMKTLNRTFQQCFTKIRIKNKSVAPKEKDEIQEHLCLKTKLQQFLTDVKSDFTRNVVEEQIS